MMTCIIITAVICNYAAFPAIVSSIPPQADSFVIETRFDSENGKPMCTVTLVENRYNTERNLVVISTPKVIFRGIADSVQAQNFCVYIWIDEHGELRLEPVNSGLSTNPNITEKSLNVNGIRWNSASSPAGDFMIVNPASVTGIEVKSSGALTQVDNLKH